MNDDEHGDETATEFLRVEPFLAMVDCVNDTVCGRLTRPRRRCSVP
jgi:hypothetical protein